jgi:hypothetical protein
MRAGNLIKELSQSYLIYVCLHMASEMSVKNFSFGNFLIYTKVQGMKTLCFKTFKIKQQISVINDFLARGGHLKNLA